MDARATDGSFAGFRGEVSVAADGAVDGWCADPARPDLRCWVEIFAEDSLAATVLAREPRPDLVPGLLADGAHGFCGRLPPELLPSRPEVLIWARVKGARRGFAQRLLMRPSLTEPAGPREAAVAGQIAELSDRLIRVVRPPPQPAASWRAGLDGLARRLARGRPGPGRPGLGRPVVDLPFARRPEISLVLPFGGDIAATLRRIAWLAPLACALAAEVLVIGPTESDLAVLPASVPNLRIAGTAAEARGGRIVLIDPDDPAPSLALLAHVLRANGDDGRGLAEHP